MPYRVRQHFEGTIYVHHKRSFLLKGLEQIPRRLGRMRSSYFLQSGFILIIC
jgi:hypothetical protein